MKFGQRLKTARKPEWADKYPDYDFLKKMLLDMARSGQNRAIRRQEDLLPHSIGGTEDRINPAGPTETEFAYKLDEEIQKVSEHYTAVGTDLRKRVDALEERYNAYAKRGLTGADVLELTAERERCELLLLKLDDFVNLSYSAFVKILKKHDKHSSCPLLLAYCVKLQAQPFLKMKQTQVIMKLSNINAKLIGKETRTEAQFDPNQAGGTSFERKTTKYWVRMSDITRVKCMILKQLPVYKFTHGDVDSDRITSIYFDNDDLDLYTGRLHKTPGAIALRMRWYGDTPAPDSPVYVERKVHNESWYGEESRKERFSLPDKLIQPYLEGKITPKEVGEILKTDKKFKGDVDKAVALAQEVQEQVRDRRLKPMVRTQYMRTAFQKKGDATVRASLDTELCMALEPVHEGQYRYDGDLTRDQICQFPHGVLEVKVQLVGSQLTPEWVEDLLNTGMLVEVNKFGKFVHGLAALLPATRVKELPYWFHQVNLDHSTANPSDSRAVTTGETGIELDLPGPSPVAGEVVAQQVRVVYGGRAPTCLEKLGKCFLNMAQPRSFQKIVTGKLVVEPKVYFANERTFLVWGSLCVQLGSIAIGILAISFHRPNVLRVGIILGGLTTIFLLYALSLFHSRAHGLRTRSTDAPYDDRFGPTMVASIMIICLAANAYISLRQSTPAAAGFVPPTAVIASQ